jgi:gas vesicle protein
MNFIYINEDAINPLLKCPICSKPFINPVIARDGVRYCRLCITEKATLVNTSELNYQPSFIENLVPMEEQLIHDMLDNLLVQCPDCQQTNILRKDLPTHLRLDCPKRIVVCKASDLKCPWSGYYDQSADHIATCTFELLRPILSERCQHEQEFEEYRKSIAEQKIEIEQLKTEIQEYKDRTEKLQKGFRTFWEIHAQQKQKCEKFQNDIQQSFTEGQNQLHQDIQQLREQYDQMNVFYQQIKDDLSKPNQSQSKEFENILQQLKEHLNQYELQVNKYQEQNLNYENQITQLQKQVPLPNNDMLHIRQMCDRHEIQIRLLARKKCVVPSSK